MCPEAKLAYFNGEKVSFHSVALQRGADEKENLNFEIGGFFVVVVVVAFMLYNHLRCYLLSHV